MGINFSCVLNGLIGYLVSILCIQADKKYPSKNEYRIIWVKSKIWDLKQAVNDEMEDED